MAPGVAVGLPDGDSPPCVDRTRDHIRIVAPEEKREEAQGEEVTRRHEDRARKDTSGTEASIRPSGRSENAKEGYAPLPGVRLFYRSMGRGEPVLFLHGGPGLPHGYLLPWMEPLARSHRLVFFDQRGVGRSDKPEHGSYGVADIAQDVDALRRSLRLGKVHLFGFSWGGALALEVAIRYPGSLRSLTVAEGLRTRTISTHASKHGSPTPRPNPARSSNGANERAFSRPMTGTLRSTTTRWAKSIREIPRAHPVRSRPIRSPSQFEISLGTPTMRCGAATANSESPGRSRDG